MAKPDPKSRGKKAAPPTAQGGKPVTAHTTLEGISLDSLAADIMCAAASNDSFAYHRLEALLKRPEALPDFASAQGITPLMAAATVGNAKGVELLASHPLVNLSRRDKGGRTALHHAAEGGHAGCVRALLSHRAPVGIKSNDGKTAFNLAQDDKVRDAFWESRDFIRHMKEQQPDHPRLQAEPVADTEQAQAAPAAEAPKAEPMKDAFARIATTVAMDWKAAPNMDVKGALASRVAGLGVEELRDAVKTIRLSSTAFDWAGVFVYAAYRGNIDAMRFLLDEFLFDQRTLNQALSAAVAAGDQRSVAHHLLIWGANPNAPHEIDGQYRDSSIFDAAVRERHSGMIEEMCLWSRDTVSKKSFEAFRRWRENMTSGDRAGLSAMTVGIHGYTAKNKLARKGTGKLSLAFNGAVANGELAVTMAAYAESRVDRMLRGTVAFSKEAGGGAIALALQHERYDFARMLIADGYRLKDAPERMRIELERKGTQKAKDFAADHVMGRLKIEPVEDVGRRKRSEIHVLMTSSRVSGGRYGIF
jgi:hypothetical protein